MIMFVDDEPFFIDSYVESLRASGFDIEVFKRISAAQAYFEQHESEVRLIVTDLLMPSRGAFEESEEDALGDTDTGMLFVKWIRNRGSSTPIIILTNKTAPDIDVWSATQKACKVLHKGPQCSPFRLEAIIRESLKMA